jgi:hypothetical protein
MADQTAFKVSNLVIVCRGWGITESGQVVSVTRCFLQIIFNASVLCNGRVLVLERKENVVLIVDGASNTGYSEPLHDPGNVLICHTGPACNNDRMFYA